MLTFCLCTIESRCSYGGQLLYPVVTEVADAEQVYQRRCLFTKSHIRSKIILRYPLVAGYARRVRLPEHPLPTKPSLICDFV